LVNTTEKQIIFTSGHSNLDLETFIKLLKDNEIEVLVDFLDIRGQISEVRYQWAKVSVYPGHL